MDAKDRPTATDSYEKQG